MHSWPWMAPMPATTPAQGASPSYMPWAASWPISRKGVPGSSSCATRSRGSSLPRAVCLARAASPPPCWAAVTWARRSSTRLRRVSALALNSAERGLIWVFRISICLAPLEQPVGLEPIYCAGGTAVHICLVSRCVVLLRGLKTCQICPRSPTRLATIAQVRQAAGTAASQRLGKQLAADQHATDFARAGADLVELGVAPQAAHRVFVGIAHAAQGLDRLAGHPGGLLGGVEDGPGGVLAHGTRMIRPVAGLAHRIDVGAAGLPGGVHVGHLALHELEFADALAELLAVMQVGQHRVHAGGHDAQGPAGEHGALVVQAAHQHLDAAAHAAQP